MNMVRIPGGTVYEDEPFFALCDRLGLMVWQDAMLAFLDPPDDPVFVATVVEELTGVLLGAAAHPSLSVVCGGQELEEQPAMFGLSRDRWSTRLADEVIPDLSSRLAPGIPYVTSSPGGGSLPFQMDRGVSHYTGVGVFLRPLDDLRRSDVRFVSEGLAFAIPPERDTVDEACGGARLAGHDPGWKRAIHHDTGGSWDLEDVRNHYVQLLFGEDPALLRRHDPERALDLGRAAVVQVMVDGHGRVATDRLELCRAGAGGPARPTGRRRVGGHRRPRGAQGSLVRAGPGLAAGGPAPDRRGAQRTGGAPGQRWRR